ncbi:unnamed protein product, partial [Tetraodon nigroviridis]
RYVSNIDKIIDEAPKDPTQDFKTQVAKLGYGLLSGEYSKPAPDPGEENDTSEPRGDQIGIAPRMFKALVGRGHPEFSTNRQQDAQEFLLHFINMVEKNCRRRSAGVRRGTPRPLQSGLRSPSRRAWRPSASQRSSQTSGARRTTRSPPSPTTSSSRLRSSPLASTGFPRNLVSAVEEKSCLCPWGNGRQRQQGMVFLPCRRQHRRSRHSGPQRPARHWAAARRGASTRGGPTPTHDP